MRIADLHSCRFINNVRLAVVILVCLLLLFTIQSHAQEKYRISEWTTDDGLPQNTIKAIVQTRDGYMWFSTNDGLVRFDGVRFKIFNRANTPELPNNRMGKLFEDKSGRLWILTEDFSFLFFENGKFTFVAKQKDLPFQLEGEIVDDGAGSIAFYTTAGNMRYENGKFVPFKAQGIPDNSELLYRDNAGGIWFRDDAGQNYLKDGQLKTYKDLAALEKIYEDRHGSFWFSGGTDNQQQIVRVKNGQVQTYPIQARGIWSIAEDTAGNLWMGTYGRGIVRLDSQAVIEDVPNEKGISSLTTADGISDNISTVVCADREGGVWVGAVHGLNYLVPQTVRVFSKLDGLKEENVYPIFEDSKGTVWIGLWQYNLAKYENGKLTNYLNADELSFVSSLFEDKDGRFWFGNERNIFYLENNKPVMFTDKTGIQADYNVISQDKNGMWFGTSKGLILYANNHSTVFTTKDGLPDDYITDLKHSKDGSLWVGTRGGIASLKCGMRNAECGFKSLTERDGLASNFTRSLYEDSDGVLWIGTYDGGLSRLKNGKFTTYTMKDGLFNNGVFCILEDNHGWFWMNSNQGIYRVRKQELNDFADGKTKFLTSVSYNKQDGLLNVEGNGGRQPAGVKTRDGKLWFPTQQGVAVIDPQSVSINPLPPPVLIEDVFIDRESIDNNTFQSAIGNRQSAITMRPGQNNLEINYTGLSFINAEQVKFKYKLEGLDVDWIEAGTRRTAYYPYLPSGEYVFRVIAANRDGVWNETGARVKVVVLPPFYKRWWFITVLLFAVSGIVFLAYKRRVGQLKRERIAQERFSKQLMESQEEERKRIAVELHDSLGQHLIVIKNWAMLGENLLTNGNPAKEQFTEIQEQATQAITEVREISHNLRPYQLERLGLTNTIEFMVHRISESSAIAFEMELDNIDGLFPKEAEINIYRIVQECLNNIIKHAEATRAAIIIKHQEQAVQILIEDNGKGFHIEPLSLTETRRRGFGLTGLHERVRLLGGKLVLQSSVGEGTKINILLNVRGQIGV